jgi:hypothetical protein
MVFKWILMVLAVITLLAHLLRPQRLPKIVWILWFQGWDKAPWLSKKCAESWKKLNPGWDVRLIDEKSCPVPIYGDTAEARSDVVRLELLAKYGGIWADSTMLCMQPLDSWVWKDIEPAGVWMYHGLNEHALTRDKSTYKECEGPASWFIVAKTGNALMNKWVTACRKYWKGREKNDNYFWMDRLWYQLYDTDTEFKDLWSKVPKICCEDPGQAHAIAGRIHQNTPDIKELLKSNPPRALKLSNKYGVDENSKDSNAHFVIDLV